MERRDFIKKGINAGLIAGLATDPLKIFGNSLQDNVRQIVIRTSWSNMNLGELASLQASQDFIQRGLPKSKIYLWPARKNDAFVEAVKGNYATLHFVDGNINESNEPDNQELADVLNSSDILLWIGGNIQDETQNDTFADSLGEFNRIFSYCHTINLKYGLIDTGFSFSEENSISVKPILDKSEFIFTRESDSYDFIKGLKTECKLVEEGTHINYSYNFVSLSHGTQYIDLLGLTNADFATLIIKTNLRSIDADYKKELCSKLSQIIKAFLAEHEIPILILPSDIGEVEVSRQYIFNPLKEEFGDKVLFIEQLLTPNIAQPIFDKSRFVISMDLSSLVLSYAAGTPSIYLYLPEYGNENSLINDLGLKDWGIDFIQTEDAEIIDALTQLHKKYVDSLVMIDSIRKPINKKQNTIIQTLGKVLYPKNDDSKKKKEKKKK